MQTNTPPSRRRTLFAAAGAAVMGSGITAGAAASVANLVPAGAEPSHIAAIGRRIKAIVDRENYLDDKRETRDFTQQNGDEEGRLYDERMALVEEVIQAMPESGADALIIMMHAADRLNFGNAIVDGGEVIDACERAIRGACAFLSRELSVDLVPFGSENFLPDHLSQHPVGRA